MQFTRDEINAALDGILASRGFLSSPRSSAFLRFVVEETLEGRATRLKAFTIATSVLGRDEAFDPQTNPIVRVEAMRLRKLIDDYYAGEGASDPVQVRIRRGSYVPEFVTGGTPVQDVEPTVEEPVVQRPPRWSLHVIVASVLIAIACLVGAAIWYSQDHTQTQVAQALPDPDVRIAVSAISVKSTAPGANSLAGGIVRGVEDSLSRFDFPVVVSDQQDSISPDYRLTGTLSDSTDGTLTLAVRMYHVPSQEIIWARSFDGISADADSDKAQATVASITTTLAQTYGVLFSDMRRRAAADPDARKDLACILLAYAAFDSPQNTTFHRAHTCLEAVVARNPLNSPAATALSYLLVSSYLDGFDAQPNEPSLDRALALARQAVSLTPQKARAHAAFFWARFFDQRFDDAFESAKLALDMNPFAADTLARVGAAHILRGRYEDGLKLLTQAKSMSASGPSWHEVFLTLGNFMLGDLDKAARHADRRATGQLPLGLLARAAVAHAKGDLVRSRAALAKLRKDHPQFASNLGAALDRYAMIPEMREKLLREVEMASDIKEQKAL